MKELKNGDEVQLEITNAAFEDLEACKCNKRSVFLLKGKIC